MLIYSLCSVFYIIMIKEKDEYNMYELGDVVEMKKPHACQTNRWEIIRMGMDIKIKCINCQHIVMMPRREFEKKMKKLVEKKSDR